MNPSILPLEYIHVEIRHEEMIQEAAQRRLAKEARQAQPSKANALQTVRTFFSQVDRSEPARPVARATRTTADAPCIGCA
jgi:hypothetical protein